MEALSSRPDAGGRRPPPPVWAPGRHAPLASPPPRTELSGRERGQATREMLCVKPEDPGDAARGHSASSWSKPSFLASSHSVGFLSPPPRPQKQPTFPRKCSDRPLDRHGSPHSTELIRGAPAWAADPSWHET